MRKIVETVLEGTVGLLALYVVARVSYDAGHRMAEAEHKYEELTNSVSSEARSETPRQEEQNSEQPQSSQEESRLFRKPKPLGLAQNIGRMFLNGRSTLARILQNPDREKIEMYVDGDTFHVDVSPRRRSPA